MSHTPGPWRVSSKSKYLVRTDKYRVCQVFKSSADASLNKQAVADAQLIAAAPELLNALKLCLYTLKQMLSDGYFHYIGAEHEIENATNAINKAEGKPCNVTGDNHA